VLSFIKCFFSISHLNCLHFKVFSRGRWMNSYLQPLTINSSRVGGDCPQDHPQSFLSAKVRPCGQTTHKTHPQASPSRCSLSACGSHHQPVAHTLRRTLKRKHPQKLEVGWLGSPTSPRALIRRPSMQGGISSSFPHEVSNMFASLRN